MPGSRPNELLSRQRIHVPLKNAQLLTNLHRYVLYAVMGFSLYMLIEDPVASAHRDEDITALQEKISALQHRVDELEILNNHATKRSSSVSPSPASPSSHSPISHPVKEEESVSITAGDFPGSYKLSTWDVSVKVGGYVKLDFIKDLDFIPSGDIFVQTAIPVDDTPDSKKDGETRFTVRQTRVNFDIRSSTTYGKSRIFFEGDFFGSNGHFEIRHAFGSLGNVLVGQTWTTFMDISAWPESLGFEGPDGAIFARQGMIRLTQSIFTGVEVALALENPSGDFTNPAQGTNSSDVVNQWPDMVFRVRSLYSWGHVQVGGLGRLIELDDGKFQGEQEVGWGVMLSGRILVWGRDSVQFQGGYGEGIGRYIQGLIGTGSDAAADSSGNLQALRAGAAFAGYQHWWTDTLRSSVAGVFGAVENSARQAGLAIKNFQGAGVNLVWNILPQVTVGGQFAWARSEVNDGRSGTARRIQTSVQFSF